MRTKTCIFLALLLMWPISGHSQEQQYSRFLLPLYPPYFAQVPGAHNSLWQVETWYYYHGDTFVDVVPRPFVCRVTCNDIGDRIHAGSPPLFFRANYGHEAGILLHVATAEADHFELRSNVRDLSRETDSAGTEIPIIPETDLRAAAIYLLDVPVGAQMRTALRIYALPEVAVPMVEVRYYRMPQQPPQSPDRELLKTDVVSLATYPPSEGYLLHPSFTFVPDIGRAAALNAERSLWIEIVPVTPALRIWAMASATNNATQQVTLTTPRQR